MVTCAKRLTYVPSTSTLGAGQLLVRLTYVHVATLRLGHPLTQPLYHFPNMIDALVELTGHHERLWVGHG